MCLGIPGEVIEFLPEQPDLAKVDVSGVKRVINVGLLADEPPKPGEWVLIHVGFALSKIDEGEAAAASASSILDRAKPTWISTHSPGLGGSSESRPTLMTRRTPLTSTLARSGCSGRNSITSPGMPRHM